MQITLKVEVSESQYALNYGEGYPRAEAEGYARTIVEDAVRQRFQQVGEWAMLVEVK